MKELKAELKKVSWPTPKQLANNTSAVIVIVVLTAIIVFALNITFEELDYATKLYFIDQVLKMDRDMKKILPNYTDYLNDDKYNNISEDLYTIGNELMKTKRR